MDTGIMLLFMMLSAFWGYMIIEMDDITDILVAFMAGNFVNILPLFVHPNVPWNIQKPFYLLPLMCGVISWDNPTYTTQ